ncbi:hypothetical protein RJT34_33050 [Clitoria ternatea]|uniref:Uncharacterized protein n=1 Tax=Clitoria ternatea TaxID=43366 RepID=A0AAN9EZ70_CLITE
MINLAQNVNIATHAKCSKDRIICGFEIFISALILNSQSPSIVHTRVQSKIPNRVQSFMQLQGFNRVHSV